MEKEQYRISVFEILGQGSATSTEDGELVFDRITKALDNHVSVILDFDKIDLLISAFLNAAVGQLYGKYNPLYVKENLTVINMLPADLLTLKQSVDRAKMYFSDQENNFRNSANQILGDEQDS